MNINYQPVIIIIAYNRTHSLQRILNSMDLAVCPEGTQLIISIDNNGSNQDVFALADRYLWKHGKKEVIYHKEHLGLRNHILFCGDLTYKYGSVIMLEEDLVVSPYFYNFVQQALNYYHNSGEISGISLYNLPYTEATKLPFISLKDDSDIYFMQVPCSLGHAFSLEQWDSFRKWYNLNQNLEDIKGLPIIVTKFWSQSSWKKFIYGYMIVKDKYFVYPQLSLTSNFNDRGENMYAKSNTGQVGLQIVTRDFKFKPLADSINVYDAYSEILPTRLKLLCPTLKDYDLEVDLFGQKEKLSKDFVLTSKLCTASIINYDRAMKPAELNVIYNIPGNVLSLAKREFVIFDSKSIEDLIFKSMPIAELIKNHEYFYTNIFDTKVLIKILIYRIKNKLRSYFGN
jgi:hypothetical protein